MTTQHPGRTARRKHQPGINGHSKHQRYWLRQPARTVTTAGRRTTVAVGKPTPALAPRVRPLDGRAHFHPDVHVDTQQLPVMSAATAPRPWQVRARRRAANQQARKSRRRNRR
jgi:hypothetical protein